MHQETLAEVQTQKKHTTRVMIPGTTGTKLLPTDFQSYAVALSPQYRPSMRLDTFKIIWSSSHISVHILRLIEGIINGIANASSFQIP